MIVITTPIQHALLVDTLDNKTIDGITYHYAGKEGNMKLLFEADSDGEQAVKTAKKAIKDTEIGSVLYFQIGERA